MNYLDLKKHLNSGNTFPSYLILGEDDYLKTSALKLLVDAVAPNNEFNQSFFTTENIDEKKLIEICNSGTFFGGKKIVVLKEYDGQKTPKLTESIKEYLKNFNESTVFVIVVNAEKSVFTLLKNIEQIKCDRLDRKLLTDWIVSTANKKNGKINLSAAELLVDYTNGFLSKIEIELNKLLDYKNGAIIDENDIVLLVKKDLEYSIFELTDALAQKNEQKALQIANDLLTDRKTASSILPLISKYFRRLFYVSVTKLSDSEIASLLNVKEYAINITRRQVGVFGAKQLKEIVELCAELDFKLKNSKIFIDNATHILLYKILLLNKR
jgi:DNA polymerase-3 subunit delta